MAADPKAETVVVVGPNAVEALLRHARGRVQRVLHAGPPSPARDRVIALARESKCIVESVAPAVLERHAGELRHQGLVALAAPAPLHEWSDLFERSEPLLVAFDQVTDPHNLGAILRSCEALGGTGALVTRGPLRPAGSDGQPHFRGRERVSAGRPRDEPRPGARRGPRRRSAGRRRRSRRRGALGHRLHPPDGPGDWGRGHGPASIDARALRPDCDDPARRPNGEPQRVGRGGRAALRGGPPETRAKNAEIALTHGRGPSIRPAPLRTPSRTAQVI
jgi:hypothetical protein